jgi:hypothetical protein
MKTLQTVGKIFLYLLLLVLVIGLVWFLVYLLIPTPQKTVRSFFNNIKLEQYSQAYKLIDGPYKEKRGTIDKFTDDYRLANVEGGTRTKKVVITEVRSGPKPNQKIVSVTVSVLYLGSIVDTQGFYLVENIPGKGWRIVDNVSSQESKKNLKGNNTMLPKSNP